MPFKPNLRHVSREWRVASQHRLGLYMTDLSELISSSTTAPTLLTGAVIDPLGDAVSNAGLRERSRWSVNM